MTSAFSFNDLAKQLSDAAEKMMAGGVKPALPFDPLAIAQATGEFAFGLAMKPAELMEGNRARQSVPGFALVQHVGRVRAQALV